MIILRTLFTNCHEILLSKHNSFVCVDKEIDKHAYKHVDAMKNCRRKYSIAVTVDMHSDLDFS